MTRTYYVPKAKTETINRFAEICDAKRENYSTLILGWIERYNEENKNVEAIKRKEGKNE